MEPPGKTPVNTRLQCLTVASVLDAGQTVAVIGHAGAVVAVFAGFAGEMPVFAAALTLWVLVCLYAVRVRLDASLFRALAGAGGHGAEHLDALLIRWRLKRRIQNRTIAERSEAAIGLLRRLIALVALEVIALSAGVALIWRKP